MNAVNKFRAAQLLVTGITTLGMAVSVYAAEKAPGVCTSPRSSEVEWAVNFQEHYGIVWKLDDKSSHFYLCKGIGDASVLVKELNIPIDPKTQQIGAGTCFQEPDHYGEQYFAVVDNKTSAVVKGYRFDVKKVNIEPIPDVICADPGDE